MSIPRIHSIIGAHLGDEKAERGPPLPERAHVVHARQRVPACGFAVWCVWGGGQGVWGLGLGVRGFELRAWGWGFIF